MDNLRTATLAEIETWPPVIDVPDLAGVLGMSTSGVYAALANGALPVKTIRVGKRIKVVTASVVELLSPTPV